MRPLKLDTAGSTAREWAEPVRPSQLALHRRVANVVLCAPFTTAPRALRLLLPGAVLLCTHLAAAANEPADATLSRLRQGGEVSCQPTLPYFCENMHVRCVGQAPVATFQFRLRGASGTGSVELVTASDEFERQYENAQVEWDKDGSYVLLMPRGSSGYLKLLAEGKYVFRHYIQSRGVMSLGACR